MVVLTRFFALLAVLALSLGTAACGGGGESGDSEGADFLTGLNAICEDSTREVIENNLELGYATDPKDQLESAKTILESRANATDEMKELEAPQADAKAFNEFLAAREDLVAVSKERVTALEEGDEEALAKNAAAAEKANAAENQAAAELGTDLCDDELPEEDAQAAEDVLREFSTTADAETSCDPEALVTETFLQDAVGGVEACEKEQEALTKNPKDLPDDIEVKNATGVDGLGAVLEYEDVGGIFDSEPTRATLYYLDGSWKIYELAPLE